MRAASRSAVWPPAVIANQVGGNSEQIVTAVVFAVEGAEASLAGQREITHCRNSRLGWALLSVTCRGRETPPGRSSVHRGPPFGCCRRISCNCSRPVSASTGKPRSERSGFTPGVEATRSGGPVRTKAAHTHGGMPSVMAARVATAVLKGGGGLVAAERERTQWQRAVRRQARIP